MQLPAFDSQYAPKFKVGQTVWVIQAKTIHPHEVYGTKEEAEVQARWHPVENISAEEWKKAIGNREEEGALETCELSICCTNVSDTRDYLFLCQENSGLIERDLQDLVTLLKDHDYPHPNGGRPEILDKILTQLGVLDQICPIAV